jgi:hypothetical protein
LKLKFKSLLSPHRPSRFVRCSSFSFHFFLHHSSHIVAIMAANNNADVFRRDFAAALGKALREAEDAAAATGGGPKKSQQELAQETYRLLCFDHPIGFTASGCRALSRALTSLERNNRQQSHESSYYALSDRLVEGIRQVSYRRATAASQPVVTENPPDIGTTATSTTNDVDGTTRIEKTDHENLASAASLSGNNINHVDEEDSTFSSSAFAALAWDVYGRVPLLCCLSSQLDEASSFLGSYRGSSSGAVDVPAAAAVPAAAEAPLENPPPPPPIQNDHLQDAALPAPHHQPEVVMNGNGHAPRNDGNNDNDDASEVWASESDPSDYAFESDWNPEQNVRELDAWATQLEHGTDPLVLSKVPEQDTQSWTLVAQAVTDLIHELNFTKISGLSKDDWKMLKVSDHLTQLIVLLLLGPTQEETTMSTTLPSGRNSQYPLLNEKDVYHWQQLALQPLHVFRDAVLSQHDGDANKGDFILKDYLQLLQTLLQVEYNTRGSSSSSSSNNDIGRPPTCASSSLPQFTNTVVPATWIGLSALSTMCSHCLDDLSSNNNVTSRRRIGVLRTVVLEASDDLCHILEQSAAGNSEAMRDAIPWSYLSLFQIFSTTTTSNHNNGVATNNAALPLPTLSNAQIQILLNSGLFRQWLLLWSKLNGEEQAEKSASAVHGAVLQSIFDLCCVSPTLLGKYSWRFPGLAAFATACVLENDATSMDKGVVSNTESRSLLQAHRHQRLRSCFSWNLLGIRLTEEAYVGNTSLSTVKWKSSSKTASSSTILSAAAPTTALAQQRAWASFQQLCANLSLVLSAWKERRRISSSATKQNPPEEQRAEELALLRLVEDDIRLLSEFNAVIDSLSNPTLQPLFKEKMTPVAEKFEAGSGSLILDLTLPIQQELATWPSAHGATSNIESGTKLKTDDSPSNFEDTDHEATSPHQAMRRRVQLEESSISAVRRSIKVLKSIMESSRDQSSVGFSSKAD